MAAFVFHPLTQPNMTGVMALAPSFRYTLRVNPFVEERHERDAQTRPDRAGL